MPYLPNEPFYWSLGVSDESNRLPLQHLEALVAMLKRHGVKNYSERAFSLQFAEQAAPPADIRETIKALASSGDEKCKCGHGLAVFHPDGPCLDGCSVEQCRKELNS